MGLFGSKHYDSIIGKLRSLMGNAEATEAEIDVFLDGKEIAGEEAKTDDGELANVQAELKTSKDTVTALTSERDTLKTDKTTLQGQLDDANTAVETLTAQLADKDTQIKNYAGQVASLKTQVSKLPTPTDAPKPQPNAGGNTDDFEEVVVSTKNIDNFLKGKTAAFKTEGGDN